METRSEHHTADNGAKVELGTITGPSGREHTAMGSILDLAGGYVVGYVSSEKPPGHLAWTPLILTTWDGRRIGLVTQVSKWKNHRGELGNRSAREIDRGTSEKWRADLGKRQCKKNRPRGPGTCRFRAKIIEFSPLRRGNSRAFV